jgi:tetratricopeptide (TPR) repeat protein
MEQLLSAVIARTPTHYQALNALGYSLADRGIRLNEARELIVKALNQVPDDPFITDSLGWVEFRLGRSQEALQLLQQAYRVRADAEIAAHLGEVMWSLGQRDQALQVWREGLRTAPDNTTLRSTLQRLQVPL